MTSYRDQSEDEDDESNTDDDADPGDDSDEEPTVPCPYCRREILEDVPQCPSEPGTFAMQVEWVSVERAET